MNTENLRTKLQPLFRWVTRYRALLFFIVLSVVYAYIIIRVNTLNNAEPTPSAVAASLKTSNNAHIDPSVVDKIKQLQDNSVNVHSLFDQARQNPFQE